MNRFGLPVYLLLFLLLLLQGCAASKLSVTRDEAYHAYNTRDYPTAVKKFEVLVQEAPKDSELWFRLGNAYARTLRPQQAISAYQNALLRNPDMAKAWYNMGLVQMQTALKSFVDMKKYVKEGNPVGLQGEVMRKGLFTLLGDDDEQDKQ